MSYGCYRLPVAGLMLLLLSACTVQGPAQAQLYGAEVDLLDGSILGAEAMQPLPDIDMLAVNDDMRAFLSQHVPSHLGDKRKVELILQAVLKDGLQLNYNNFKTYTAQEAFYARECNCLSFTNLFVALAREAGVNARYQEVQVPPTWALKDDTWMFNLHINVVVDMPGSQQIVDFDMASYDSEYHSRLLSDTAALARYHNNMAVHWMAEEDLSLAFRHYRKALQLRPETGYVWTNLGTLYKRAGHPERAEQAYLRAIRLDNEPAAMSNLARLYRQQAKPQLAIKYESKVYVYRRKNPYYLFHLAEEAYASSDYSQTKRLLRSAIHLLKDEQNFYHLLGLTHIQLGEIGAAQKRFHQASALAASDVEREHYNHKLKLLAGS